MLIHINIEETFKCYKYSFKITHSQNVHYKFIIIFNHEDIYI